MVEIWTKKIHENIEADAHGNIQLSGTGALGDFLIGEVKKVMPKCRMRADTFGYLQRSFPGTPPEGMWVREETIAGVPARRVESCTQTREGPRSRWTCLGTLEGPGEGDVRLVESESTTEVVADRHGLVRLEGTYAGTLVMLRESDGQVVDRPIAGQRLVVRQ